VPLELGQAFYEVRAEDPTLALAHRDHFGRRRFRHRAQLVPRYGHPVAVPHRQDVRQPRHEREVGRAAQPQPPLQLLEPGEQQSGALHIHRHARLRRRRIQPPRGDRDVTALEQLAQALRSSPSSAASSDGSFRAGLK
jgi:hypothetical protein